MFRAAIRHKNLGEDHRVTMDAKIVSRTPGRDFRCLYPCDIIRILYVCRVEIEVSNPRNDLADRNRGLPRFRSARSFRGLETSI